jgi:Tol biopolymer transport system component
MRTSRLIGLVAVSCAFFVANPGSARATFPGGNGRIAFENLIQGPDGLWVIGPDGSNRQLLSTAGWQVHAAAWSAKGRRIAFVREASDGERLVIARAGGDYVRTVLKRQHIWNIAWAPGGRRFAVCLGRLHHQYVATVHVDGSHVDRIGRVGDCDPAWSPTGGRLAVANRDGNRKHETLIATMRPDGGGRRVVTHNGLNADWSPNAARLVFVRYRNHHSDLFTVSPDGSGLDRLTTTAGFSEGAPVWSPDGKWIACARWSNDPPPGEFVVNGDLVVIRVVNATVTKLTDTPNIDEWEPDWRPV